MSPTSERVEVKLGKRKWHLLVTGATEPGAEAARLDVDTGDDPAELLLLLAPDETLRERWADWVRTQQDKNWDTRWLPASPSVAPNLLPDGGLVVGPARLVERFCGPTVPAPTTTDAPTETPPEGGGDAPVRRRIASPPNLPDPADVLPFPQEGLCDPFGQDAALQSAAWSEIARFAGRMVGVAHRHGLAATLPPPPPGLADPDIKPWRTVVPLEEGAKAGPEPHNREPTPEYRFGLPADQTPGLDLLQRCLLTCTALQTRFGTNPDWDGIAIALEDFGYLLVSRGLGIEKYPSLMPYFELGSYAAKLHRFHILHGDMHTGNFSFLPPDEADNKGKKHELGDRAISFDFGDSYISDRPLTPRQRAQDLAILKARCDFITWEAVKLGYRFQDAGGADQVFQHL